jgi:hypothetical protein
LQRLTFSLLEGWGVCETYHTLPASGWVKVALCNLRWW